LRSISSKNVSKRRSLRRETQKNTATSSKPHRTYTSPKGAAVRDVVRILRRRFHNVHLTVFPVRVQEKVPPKKIVRALRFFNQRKLVDVLILARGGGSIEISGPSTKRLSPAPIFRSEIPVISGVGHETDFTLPTCRVRSPLPLPARRRARCANAP